MARGTWAGGIPSWRGSFFFLELLDCWLGLSFPWTFSESKLLLGLVAVFGSVLEVSTFLGSCAPFGTLTDLPKFSRSLICASSQLELVTFCLFSHSSSSSSNKMVFLGGSGVVNMFWM